MRAAPRAAGCRAGSLPAASGERHELEGRTVPARCAGRACRSSAAAGVAFHGFRSSPDDLRGRNRAGAAGSARNASSPSIPRVTTASHSSAPPGAAGICDPTRRRDRDFVRALLDRLEGERCIDQQRIYATGMSRTAGSSSSLLGCQLADRLAAVAPVAGALDLGACRAARPVPILFLYGSRDPIVAPDMVDGAVDWWTARNACRSSAPSEGCTRWSGCAADVVACEGTQGHIVAIRRHRAHLAVFRLAGPFLTHFRLTRAGGNT